MPEATSPTNKMTQDNSLKSAYKQAVAGAAAPQAANLATPDDMPLPPPPPLTPQEALAESQKTAGRMGFPLAPQYMTEQQKAAQQESPLKTGFKEALLRYGGPMVVPGLAAAALPGANVLALPGIAASAGRAVQDISDKFSESGQEAAARAQIARTLAGGRTIAEPQPTFNTPAARAEEPLPPMPIDESGRINPGELDNYRRQYAAWAAKYGAPPTPPM